MHPDFPPMYNNQSELDFVLNQLKPTDVVLEWGSGGSTLAFAPKVKELVSIEHLQEWYDKIRVLAPDNTQYYYVERNKEEAPGHDGTYEDYKNYVDFPGIILKKHQFDKIIIDGRARVACAKAAIYHRLLKEGGTIFIHDYRNPNEQYRRHEYEEVEQFLDIVAHEYAMYQFKPKPGALEMATFMHFSKMREKNSPEIIQVTGTQNHEQILSVMSNQPDTQSCWHQNSVIEEMNRFYDQHRHNPDVLKHFTAFKSLLSAADGAEVLDLGCGTAITSEYCLDRRYLGADLPHVIAGCAMRNYPQYLYKACDIEKDDLSWIRFFDVIITSGMIDIMQDPMQVLRSILSHASQYVIIHRQEITEAGATRSEQRPSYGGYTWHSIINRADFLSLLDDMHFYIAKEEKLEFSNWENGGSSFLLRKRKSWAIDNMDYKLYDKYFKGKENGVFVEAGANDGVTQSNTMYFEFYKNWSGILIEPQENLLAKCIENRSPRNLYHCVALSDHDGIRSIPFISTPGNNGLMSMMQVDGQFDDKLLHRIRNEETINTEVESCSFNDILSSIRKASFAAKKQFDKIDLFVLDVEGAELLALKGIDFDNIIIDYLLIEELEENDIIKDYLAKWYDQVDKPGHHDYLYKRK